MVALFFFGIIYIAIEHSQSIRSIRDAQISNLANHLARTLEIPLGTEDTEAVYSEIERAIGQTGVMRITVIMPGMDAPLAMVNPAYTKEIDSIEDKKRHVVTVFSHFENAQVGKPLGDIIIEDDARRQTSEMWRTILITSIELMGGIFMLAYFVRQVTRNILRPVERLSAAIDNITEGVLDFDFQPSASNELRTIENTVLRLKEASLLNEHMSKENIRLEKEAARARESKRVRTEFLAHISHEIRNPLQAICGYSELLANEPEVVSTLSVEHQSRLRTVARSAHHLTNIVSDMLDFARLEAGTESIEEEPVNLWDLLEDLCDIHAVRARSKGVGLDLIIDPSVPRLIEAPDSAIRKVVGNLISNATKFTDEGHVEVHAKAVEIDPVVAGQRSRSWISVRVSDTGPGIPEDELQKVTDPFYQVDRGTTKVHEGSGLGLAIANKYLALMGGYIRHLKQDKGTSFEVSWPIKVLPDEIPKHPNDAHPDLTAVVVAPRESQRRAISGALLRNGFDATVEYASMAEVDAHHGFPFDLLIISDEAGGLANMVRPCRLARKSVLLMSREDTSKYRGVMEGEGADLHLMAPLLGEDIRAHVIPMIREGTRDRRKEKRLEGYSKMRVLVIDDEEVNTDVLRGYLSKLGVQNVDAAVSGAEALYAMHISEPYDLVITDLHMPKMDGYELVEKIRQIDAFVPIVAMTADNQKDVVTRLKDAGVREVLGKPLNRDKLRKVITSVSDASGTSGTMDIDLSVYQARYQASMLKHGEQLEEGMMSRDEARVREVLHTMIGNAGMMQEMGTAESLEAIREHVKASRWDAAQEAWREIKGGCCNA